MPQKLSRNMVEVKDLWFSYGDLNIFRGISLEIERGRITTILGASGCGKSTLLKVMDGQLGPDRGKVIVEGRNIHELDPQALYRLRLEMGMMFQTSGLFTDLSVFDNVAFPIRENFDVPPEALHQMVLMKLHA